MDASTRAWVRERAGNLCEYCLLPQEFSTLILQIEHVIAKQHDGDDSLANLALACDRCNLHKGPNLSGIDPESKKIVPLFNPRDEEWDDHFTFDGALIRGLTPTGRATVRVLDFN